MPTYQPNVTKKIVLSIVVVGALFILFTTSLRLFFIAVENRSNLEATLEGLTKATTPDFIHALDDRDSAKLKALLQQLVKTTAVNVATLTYSDNQNETILQDQHNGKIPRWPIQAQHTVKFAYINGQAQLNISGIESFFTPTTAQEIKRKLFFEALLVAVLAMSILFMLRHFVFQHITKLASYLSTRSSDNLNEPLILQCKLSKGVTTEEFNEVTLSIEKMRKTLLNDIAQKRATEIALLDKKEQQRKTQQLIDEAKASNRAKSEFIATMSHEIRTPLNGVVGMVEMLRDTPLNDNQKHYLDILYRSGESLLEIINDILDYSKIESGRMLLESIAFDLEELIDNCFKLFGATANKRDIELISNILPGTPTHLIGDPTRLRQIIINLLGNAFKFTNKGHIILEVAKNDATNLFDQESPSLELKFAIEDSGIGIPKVDQRHLFEAFRQADSSTTRKFGGSGLGLAICKQLAELMGGDIGIDSDADQGSTFWFTSKLHVNRQELIENPPSCSLALSNKRLLSVNFSKALTNVINSHTHHWNLTHEHTSDIEKVELFDRSGRARYAFIILNHQLCPPDSTLSDNNIDTHTTASPKQDGFEIARYLREKEGYANIPILLLTNQQASSFTQEQLFSVTSIIPRPVAVKNLENVLISQGHGTTLNPLMPPNSFKTLNKDLHVLVAEDNTVNQMVIEGLLSKFNIVPDFADNGCEAVDMFFSSKKPYDLVLMDCEMPEMNGFEATKKIRQQEKDRAMSSTPIIALTAHVEASHRTQVYDCGMNHFLSKPLTIEKLDETLSSVGLNTL